MVRVAGLWQQIETRTTEISIDGRSPLEQLELIRHEITGIIGEIYRLWREDLKPELGRAGIRIANIEELNAQQKTFVDEYFRREIYPVLTPLAVDQGRPFPHISNLSLNVAASVCNGNGIERFAGSKCQVPCRIFCRCRPTRANWRSFGWSRRLSPICGCFFQRWKL